MRTLLTTGEIYRIFKESDPDTIIRKKNIRYYARNHGIKRVENERSWLIDLEELIDYLSPCKEVPRTEMPIIRCKRSALYLFNKRHDYSVDKHTIDRCCTNKVGKFKLKRKWYVNYYELEQEIERRVEKGLEKKR